MKYLAAASLAGSLILGGMVVTSVHIAGAKTNQMENGEWRVDNVGVAASTLHSPFSILHSTSPITDDDIAAGWKLGAIGGAEEGFAASPSNSLMLTWQNAAYGRDANCPTNFQAELFPDGGFVYRYQDRTERYVAISPWDWDGDGLENSVDPEPKAAGPDAHGTNAEWFNNVCSNVFVATENADGAVELAPRSSSVKTNAYYFADVVAADGPAPIYFRGAQPGRLGMPVVMARAGETNHVPLLIGVEYAVTSPVPFTVSAPTNGFAEDARKIFTI